MDDDLEHYMKAVSRLQKDKEKLIGALEKIAKMSSYDTYRHPERWISDIYIKARVVLAEVRGE